jgi:hypothetical protein
VFCLEARREVHVHEHDGRGGARRVQQRIQMCLGPRVGGDANRQRGAVLDRRQNDCLTREGALGERCHPVSDELRIRENAVLAGNLGHRHAE